MDNPLFVLIAESVDAPAVDMADQDARLTFSTLSRGPRSMWTQQTVGYSELR